MEFGVWRSGRSGTARTEVFFLRRDLVPERPDERGRGGNRTPLGDEESVGRDRERRVVVEPAPPSTFVVIEADLLLQVLEVAFDAPAQFCRVDELRQGRVGRQCREPIFGRGILALGHSISSHSSGHGSARQ